MWKYVSVCFCITILASLGSCQASKYQIRKSIEAGSTAMEAACAFNYEMVTDGSLCAITLLKSGKEN